MAETCSFPSSFCSILICFFASLDVETFLVCETLMKFIISLITALSVDGRRWFGW
ncbi:hypothetical protein F2Q69_00059813 [Brassica cretica]|uniref:Uncharacterized protein n=1 Tax=Brassica cretica TaxID=69181 RepID=A0A8S9RDG5_BRACR|nr:hypothetical protein F2Q69_00059813 [Brassica cretica]